MCNFILNLVTLELRLILGVTHARIQGLLPGGPGPTTREQL